ncbi:iron ABC transporter permease [Bacillus wiedmannii]|uniref:FecCD family ABC transporter permease n=1 Tax=Bacillus wiedmannii TaxID=1890302 RepID=UPI002E231B69|nr:iron ABC transporter permease [Bacillus wiedmannii]
MIGITMLLVLLGFSMTISTLDISISTVASAILHFNGSKEHMIIHSIYMPRAILTVCIGANLAVAGVLMQALTRNALASPGTFGINAGAAFVMVFSSVLYPNIDSLWRMLVAFVGGGFTALIVYIISTSTTGRNTEIKMALTGVTIQSLFLSFTQSVLIFNEQKTETILFWLAGSVAGKGWTEVYLILPWSVTILILACCFGKFISILALGEEVASGLGLRVSIIRFIITLLVIILAGTSVSVAGPIGFIGLVVPHIVRQLVGDDYRILIPLSGIFGSLLLVIADMTARFISFPYETPVGVVTALCGAPYFIYLMRRKRRIS